MKKLFYLLLTFISLAASGQPIVEQTAMFRFSEPETLNPAITPGVEAGDYVQIAETVFSDKDVQLSFRRGYYNLVHTGANVVTGGELHNFTPYLTVGRHAKIVIETGGHTLKEVKLHGMFTGDVVSHDDFYFKGLWPNLEYMPETDIKHFEPSDSLILWVTGFSPELDSIEVVYEHHYDILIPEAVSIEDYASVYDLADGIALKFNREVSVNPEVKVMMDSEEQSVVLRGHASMDDATVVVFTCEEELNAGLYTITVPAGAIMAKNGLDMNSEFVTHVNVLPSPKTFRIESIDPEPGDCDMIPSQLVLTFPGIVDRCAEGKSVLVLNKSDEIVRQAVASLSESDEHQVVLNFVGSRVTPITAQGLYTLVIPEGLCYNVKVNPVDDERIETYNPAARYEYNVGSVHYASEKTLAEAEALLDIVGVGYPSLISAERKHLSDLVLDKEALEQDVLDAMAAYITTNDIELPTAKKFYTISNVAADSVIHYLGYADSTIIITKNVEDAYPFEAVYTETEEDVEPKLMFMTQDSLYLHTLVNTDLYVGTTEANVTIQAGLVNELTLQKFQMANVDSTQTFGLVSIYGRIGTKGDKDYNAYSTIHVKHSQVLLDPDETMYFSDIYSSAFRIVEVAEPEPEPIFTEYILTPKGGTTGTEEMFLEYVTLSLLNVKDVTYAKPGIELVDANNKVTVPVEVKIGGEDNNVVTLHFPDVANGAYTLAIPEGTFTYMLGERLVPVQEIKATFVKNHVDDFVYDYDTKNAVYLDNWPKTEVLHPTQLETIVLYVLPKQPFAVDPTKEIVIRREKDHRVFYTGHFDSGVKALTHLEFMEVECDSLDNGKTVFYTRIDTTVVVDHYYAEMHFTRLPQYETVPDEVYELYIPEGTFGDENFAKYLEDKRSVAKSDCHVNQVYAKYFDVKNDLDAISEINSEVDSSSLIIYDLMGRKVSSPKKGGIYIINGQKVLK